MSMSLVLVAIVPAIFLMMKVYQADRLEKEPLPLLFKLVGCGVLSALVAIVLEMLGERMLDLFLNRNHILYKVIYYFVVIAGSEELMKYCFLKKESYHHPAYNCLFDGVVYAVTVSLGFALFENILYVWEYGFSIGIMRAFTAIPGHACFGVFMGVWYGHAKQMAICGNKRAEKWNLVWSVLIPLWIHGAYDYVLSIETPYVFIMFILFVLILFPFTFRLVKKRAADDIYLEDTIEL